MITGYKVDRQTLKQQISQGDKTEFIRVFWQLTSLNSLFRVLMHYEALVCFATPRHPLSMCLTNHLITKLLKLLLTVKTSHFFQALQNLSSISLLTSFQ